MAYATVPHQVSPAVPPAVPPAVSPVRSAPFAPLFVPHRSEFDSSAIARSVSERNNQSLVVEPFGARDEALELLYDLDTVKRDNTGRISGAFLRKHNYLNDGGWFSIGYDLSTGKQDQFICLKPDSPRSAQDGKTIKYEQRRNVPSPLFVPNVPLPFARSIILRTAPQLLDQWEQFLDSYTGDDGFAIWEFSKSHSVPLTITEGVKKAESLISNGYLSVGFLGIWNWIDANARTYINDKGEEKRNKELTKAILPLISTGTEITLVFDEDSKPKTIKNVAIAQKVLGKILTKHGARVSVLRWNHQDGKGIDDAIAAKGIFWLHDTYQNRLPLAAWLYWNHYLSHVDKRLNKPFLTKDDLTTTAKLLAVKSAKGTGKTEAIAAYCQDYIKQGIPVLLLSHRVQLVRELSERFGIDNAYDFRVSETKGLLGLALCVDSLHSESQVRFDPDQWDEFVLVMDEVEQVIPHLLISTGTDVAKHRTEVLSNVSALCQDASKVILSDADLSDDSIRYIQSLTGQCSLSTICNDYQKGYGRKLFVYRNPEELLMSVHESVQGGKTTLICTDSQQAKSTWGTINLESVIAYFHPEAKILRIDSESIGDKHHPAYRCIESLESIISAFDVVIYSPVISTGVSIDLPNHFDAIYSFNCGTQSENSTRQFISRLRDNIPVHIFLKSIGNGKLAGGETETYDVLKSNNRRTKQNLKNLNRLGYDAIQINGYSLHEQTYCSYVAKHNLGLSKYKETVIEGLRREGYSVSFCGELPDENRKEIRDGMLDIRNDNYSKLTEAIVAVESPDEIKLKQLERKQELTEAERHQLKKGKLKQQYGVEIDEELVREDDNKLYPQLSLQFWLTVGRGELEERDKKKAESYAEKTKGQGFSPDFNRTQYQAKVQVMEILKMPEILAMENQEITAADLQWWQEVINPILENPEYCREIKRHTGIWLSKDKPVFENLGYCLKKMGMKLSFVRRLGKNKGRAYVRKIEQRTAQKDDIFEYWSSQLSTASQEAA